ncbi:MAG: sigma-70 family RNA polymerase sigma factor [Lachnospiraceae bacterium]|nr:sigma-70 family RNA polymerase sigma factor [Lachnospiraceae bacterium]
MQSFHAVKAWKLFIIVKIICNLLPFSCVLLSERPFEQYKNRRITLDTQEYERLAEKYLDCIYRVAVNGCNNLADAEDVVQNTFVKLWERTENFEDEDHARKWLIRVAVNECHSLWRSGWKRRTTYLEELTEESVFSTPEKSELYFAVQNLPQKYRQIVYLYYYEEYSIREIGGMLKLSETAVKSRLLRARQKLKGDLKEAWNE